jgi:hypothetical protein
VGFFIGVARFTAGLAADAFTGTVVALVVVVLGAAVVTKRLPSFKRYIQFISFIS